MPGRLGDRMTNMNGGSTASYLACTPRVPLFMLILVLVGLEAKGLLDFQVRRGIASVVRWNLRPFISGAEPHRSERRKISFFLRRRP